MPIKVPPAETTVVQKPNSAAERNGLYIVPFLNFSFFFFKKKEQKIKIEKENIISE